MENINSIIERENPFDLVKSEIFESFSDNQKKTVMIKIKDIYKQRRIQEKKEMENSKKYRELVEIKAKYAKNGYEFFDG